MAKDVAALERELDHLTKEIGRLSWVVQKGEKDYASAHKPSPVLDKLRRMASKEPIQPSAKWLLDEQTREQKRTERWMRDERSIHLAKLKSLKRRMRAVRSRLRAAGQGREGAAATTAAPREETAPLQPLPVLGYKSRVKLAFLHVLVTRPHAKTLSVLQICCVADEEGAEVPEPWRRKGVRSYEAAYGVPKFQQDIHRWVDKVKADLKRKRIWK